MLVASHKSLSRENRSKFCELAPHLGSRIEGLCALCSCRQALFAADCLVGFAQSREVGDRAKKVSIRVARFDVRRR